MNRLLLLYSLFPFFCACKHSQQISPEQLIDTFYQECQKRQYAIVDDALSPNPDTLIILDSEYMSQLDAFANKYYGYFLTVLLIQEDDQLLEDKALRFEMNKILRATDNAIFDDPLLEGNLLYQIDPSIYNVGTAIRRRLRKTQQSDSLFIEYLKTDLRTVPLYYEAAKTNLIKVSHYALPQTNKAIEQNSDTYFLLAKSLPLFISKTTLPAEEKNLLLQLNEQARLAVKDYIAYCNSLKFEHFDNEQNAKH